MKSVVRLENGYKVAKPKVFDLIVSSDIAPIASEILNTANNGRVTELASDGSNSNKKNVFNFDWNKVALHEYELLGDYDKHGNQIGFTANMWFLRNPLYCQRTKCFKMIKLYEPLVQNYKVTILTHKLWTSESVTLWITTVLNVDIRIKKRRRHSICSVIIRHTEQFVCLNNHALLFLILWPCKPQRKVHSRSLIQTTTQH